VGSVCDADKPDIKIERYIILVRDCSMEVSGTISGTKGALWACKKTGLRNTDQGKSCGGYTSLKIMKRSFTSPAKETAKSILRFL
jgi:hypothetical protein